MLYLDEPLDQNEDNQAWSRGSLKRTLFFGIHLKIFFDAGLKMLASFHDSKASIYVNINNIWRIIAKFLIEHLRVVESWKEKY